MHLIKYLQAQGLGSRKLCTELIHSGAVALNRKVLLDSQASIQPDKVHTLHIHEQEIVTVPLPYFYMVLHKPAHYETSHKPQQYPSVFSLLPDNIRALTPQAVGRLDADTTGVLLITNDGQFNHRLTSPKHKVKKIYRVRLKHPADDTLCLALCHGVRLHDDDETVRAHAAQLLHPTVLMLTLTEGKYHQVKRMVAAAGNRVEALHREHFGPWSAEDLAPGEWRWTQPK